MKKDKQIPESYLDDAHIKDIDLEPVIFDTPEEGGTWWVVSDGSEPLMYACAKGDSKVFDYCCDYGGEDWHLPIDEIYIQAADEYDMEFINDALAKEQMVEDLEKNEDTVECKECFDLFPKADCIKKPFGYLCPSCQKLHPVAEPVVDNKTITFDLFDQEFPDVQDYDPGTTKDWGEEPTINDALDALVADEVEAVDGYSKVIDAIENDKIDVKDADKLKDTLDHIKEEEEEHIDELKDFLDLDDSEYAKDDDDEDAEDETKNSSEDKEDAETLTEATKDEFDEIMKLSKEIGIETGADANKFTKDEVGADDTVLKRLRSYRAELGDDFKVEENLTEESREGKKLWLCMFEDREVGEVWASDEDEAAELMMKEYPEYPYGLYDGCFHVCPADEDDLDETIDISLDTEVENESLRESYARARSIAKQSGTSHIFGYTSRITEDFVALDDPMEIDDIDELEADLALAYEDFGKAVVVEPEDPEILTEANWLTKVLTGENHNLNSIFPSGYLILVSGGNTATQAWEAKNHMEADALAKKASKAYKNQPVLLYGKAVGKAYYDTLVTPVQELLADPEKPTRIAMYRNGKAAMDRAGEMTKVIKANKQLTTLTKLTGATDLTAAEKAEQIADKADEIAATMDQPTQGKADPKDSEVVAAAVDAAKATKTGNKTDAAAEDPEVETPDEDDEESTKTETIPVTPEVYEIVDKIFTKGYSFYRKKENSIVKPNSSATTIAEVMADAARKSKNNQDPYYVLGKTPDPSTLGANGRSILSHLMKLYNGITPPAGKLGDRKSQYFILCVFDKKGKRVASLGGDLLKRLSKRVDMFNELFTGADVDTEAKEDDAGTDESRERNELIKEIWRSVDQFVEAQNKEAFTPESYEAFLEAADKLKRKVNGTINLKELKKYTKDAGLGIQKMLGKYLKFAKTTDDADSENDDSTVDDTGVESSEDEVSSTEETDSEGEGSELEASEESTPEQKKLFTDVRTKLVNFLKKLKAKLPKPDVEKLLQHVADLNINALESFDLPEDLHTELREVLSMVDADTDLDNIDLEIE
jgi:hypothetical protein